MPEHNRTARQLEKERKKLAKLHYAKKLAGELPPEVDEALSAKNKEIQKAIAKRLQEEMSEPQVVKNVTDKLDTRQVQKLKTSPQFTKSIGRKLALRKLMKKAGKGLKAIPILGTLAALGSEDASAAVPILNEAGDLGPQKGSASSVIEDPTASPEMRRKALERLRRGEE